MRRTTGGLRTYAPYHMVIYSHTGLEQVTYEELKVNPQLCNILVALPTNQEPVVLMDSITSFYFSNESHVNVGNGDSSSANFTVKKCNKRTRISKLQVIL